MARTACSAAALLWAGKLSRTTTSPGLRVEPVEFHGLQKMRRSIGASMTKGAVRASHRRPAMKVCVFQCPNGTFESSLCPFGLRPRRRAILVVVPVSSSKIPGAA